MLHHSSLRRKAVLVVYLETDGAMRVVQLIAAFIGVVEAFVPKQSTLMRSSAACLQYRRPTIFFHQVNHFRVRQPRPELFCVSAPSGTKLEEREDRGAEVMGVIVCDHGSRRENANEMLFEVTERYRAFAGFDIVESAHMELASPSIEQAFDRCVAAGAQKIVLHPFFLSPGRHVTSDIPGLMEAAAKKHPDVAWMVSDPLGLQELMPRLMHAAVSESVERGAWRFGADGEPVIVG